MAMGAATSSRTTLLRHQLSRPGQILADRLTQEGRASLQVAPLSIRRAVFTAAQILASCEARRSLSDDRPWLPHKEAARLHRLLVGNARGPVDAIAHRSTHHVASLVAGVPTSSAGASPARALAAVAPTAAPSQSFLQEFGGSAAGPVVAWEAVGRWVVFSDLHLSRRTLDVCLHTLQLVHREAARRDAGILFLGDFWHERGALPVEPLNQVLQVMQAWKRPTLMIPGNHDQVSIGGDVHSLTPLEAASPYIRVLHQPTVVCGALFVPYRRDHQAVLDAMRAHPHVQAVFAHIDVAGAYMNDSFQAKDGIRQEDLRADVPIYTGHYHKPHTVEGTRVQYVGSPYQVSRGEAGQQKQLLVLDKDWKEMDVVPIAIGPRHFSVAGATPALPEDLRAGDRLRWEVPPEWALTVKKAQPSKTAPLSPVAESMAALRRVGVEVEVVYPLPTSTPRIQKAEELDAFSLFSKYAEAAGLSPAAAARGHALLRSLDLPAKSLRKPRADVVFRRLELEGFGPFLSPTHYCLGPARGLRAITGSIQDGGQGTDSNGAGKTTLVMAPLWALTGSTDPRPGAEGGLLLSEVVHHAAASARVRLEGDVNGRPFVVERTAGRRSGLRFEYDGEDRTQQEMRLTQEKINDLMDTASLRRIAFHGQHTVGGLLEANDREFKEELSRVVSMEVWAAAAEACKRLLKQRRSELEHLEGAAEELDKRLAAYHTEIERTRLQQAEFAAWQTAELATLEPQLAAAQTAQSAVLQRCIEAAARLDYALRETAALVSACEERVLDDTVGGAWAGPSVAVSEEEEEAAALEQDAQMDLVEKRAQVRTVASAVDAARSRLASFSAANPEAAICERCLQPVTGEHRATSIAAMQADLAREEARYNDCRQEAAEAEALLQEVRAFLDGLRGTRLQQEAQHRSEMEHRRAAARADRQELQQARAAISSAERVRDDARNLDPEAFDRIRSSMDAAELRRDTAGETLETDGSAEMGPSTSYGSGSIGEVRKRLEALLALRDEVQAAGQEARGAMAATAGLERREQEVAGARDPQGAQMETLTRMEAQGQADLSARLGAIQAAESEVAVLRAVEVAVGLAGIQSYVLEGALAELEARTAALLETLSGGSLGLHLAATKMGRTTKREQEKIDKIVKVRLADGRIVDRSLRQLSGGERQRVAVALQLAFADFAAERSGVHSDLIVLDEAFQHLDAVGRSRMLRVLRGLPQGSVLVVSQANGELAGMFDLVDQVVKDAHTATLLPGPD